MLEELERVIRQAVEDALERRAAAVEIPADALCEAVNRIARQIFAEKANG